MTPAEHLAAALADLAELPAIRAQLDEMRAAVGRTGTADPLAIVPSKLYTRDEAAALLRFEHRPKTVSEIPEADLPRCRVGPARGSVRYLGADILAYAKGLPMPDTGTLMGEARERYVRRLERGTTVHAPPRDPAGRRKVR